MRVVKPIVSALSTILLVASAVAATATPALADAVYPVMNTSEYPPDGINFRSGPDWNTRVALTGYGVYAGESVRLKCWTTGSNVPRRDGGSNIIWYQADNVSRPSAAGRANSGWINAHFVNDGTGPNEHVGGVPDCNAPQGPVTPATDWRAVTDDLLFTASIGRFVSSRFIVGPTQFDWSTDNCSAPFPEPARSRPAGFDFRAPCWRHDFGYRNYKGQNRFNESARQRIDDNFKRDLYNVCNQFYGTSSARGVLCRRIADTYYGVVRGCGSTPAPACPERLWKATKDRLQLFRIVARY